MPNGSPSKKPLYVVAGLFALGLLGLMANATGLFSFITGVSSLPEALNPPAVESSQQQRSAAPVDGTQTEASTPVHVNSIALPATVFGYDSYGHETRQSHSLYSNEVTGAYAYSYWEDAQGIWADATVAAGDGIGAAQVKLTEASAAGQLTQNFGSETCVWRQDSDPNTPRHEVWCFRIDESRGIAMIVTTHTAEVGEITPATLANEIWNLTVLS